MYLKDNPLLRRPIQKEDVKLHPIGHWGTIAGQNFIYAHLNRAINKYDLDMFYIEGPGHGGQAVSYTHLDVYKRQVWMRFKLRIQDTLDYQWVLHQWLMFFGLNI